MPTYDEEADAAQLYAGIAGSWAGGADGMQVTDALLRQVDVACFLFCVDVLWSHPSFTLSIGSTLAPRALLPGLCEAK